MTNYKKRDYPVDRIRTFIEPGPIVLVSSAWQSKMNIMTMGWQMNCCTVIKISFS